MIIEFLERYVAKIDYDNEYYQLLSCSETNELSSFNLESTIRTLFVLRIQASIFFRPDLYSIARRSNKFLITFQWFCFGVI